MKTKRKYVRKTKTTEGNYTANIKILGRTHTSTASDIQQAIESLPVGKVAKGVSILEVIHGDKRKSIVLSPPQTFRLFSAGGIIKEINMKQLLARFSGI